MGGYPQKIAFLNIPGIYFSGIILLHEKFLQIDWLRALVFQLSFEIPTCENYKPFAGSSINK